MRLSILVRGSYLSLLVSIRFKDFEIKWLVILLGLQRVHFGRLSGLDGFDLPLLLFLDDLKSLAALWSIDKKAILIILQILVTWLILFGEFYLKRDDGYHLDWGPVEHRVFRALSNRECTLTLPCQGPSPLAKVKGKYC